MSKRVWNFVGAEMAGGSIAPKPPRGGFVFTVTHSEENAELTGVNLTLTLKAGQHSPSGEVLNPASFRTVRKNVPYPKPTDGPSDFSVKNWLKLFHLTTGRQKEALQGGAFEFDPLQLFTHKPDICVDYTPDATENTYTAKDGTTKTGKNDNIWFLTKPEMDELNTRLRGEASVQVNAGAAGGGQQVQQVQQTQAVAGGFGGAQPAVAANFGAMAGTAAPAAGFQPMGAGGGVGTAGAAAAGFSPFGGPTGAAVGAPNGMGGAGGMQAPGGLAGALGGFGNTGN